MPLTRHELHRALDGTYDIFEKTKDDAAVRAQVECAAHALLHVPLSNAAMAHFAIAVLNSMPDDMRTDATSPCFECLRIAREHHNVSYAPALLPHRDCDLAHQKLLASRA